MNNFFARLRTLDFRWYLLTLILAAFGLWSYALWPRQANLQVEFLDVGQGDAIFLETPHHKQVLVDGGPDDAVLTQLGEVMGPADRTIDLVVLSHPDADHVAGLIPVLERYEVAMIIENHLEKTQTAMYTRWQELLALEGAEVIQAETGMQVELGDGVELAVYASEEEEENVNDNSVVMRLMQAGHCFVLLTGDIEAPEEKELLKTGYGVDCDVLKSPHHGSKTSSSPVFFAAVNPQAVVISVGKDNRFGHPSEEVLTRYGDLPLYRTDEHGRISFSVKADGIFSFNTQK